MPVFRGSRYEGVPFTGILGEDGRVRKFLHARKSLQFEDGQTIAVVHQHQVGDELDALVSRVAGKPRLWWVVADMSDVLFPFDIEPGREITVPVAELNQRQEFSS